jgi:hypothetical protein
MSFAGKVHLSSVDVTKMVSAGMEESPRQHTASTVKERPITLTDVAAPVNPTDGKSASSTVSSSMPGSCNSKPGEFDMSHPPPFDSHDPTRSTLSKDP